ncbi:MAG: major capsid protein [Puniceicoccales bacterium]|jgi:hypothetical protein|nr:major capsid protein [Puniceicoccales bacterium]
MKSNAVSNPVLSGIFRKSILDSAGFAAATLAPRFSVGEQAANYYVSGAANVLNVPTLKPRAPGAAFQRSTFSLSDDTYNCRNYGHESPVPREVRAKYGNAFDADKEAIERNASIILLNWEIRVQKLATSAAVTSATPTAKWDDYANTASDPVADVACAKELVRGRCGIKPNTMVLGEGVFQKLRLHPAIRKFFYGNTDGVITLEMLKAIFEVAELKVASAMINTAAEGQDLSPADIWGDDVVLAVNTPNGGGLTNPGAFRTFAWEANGIPSVSTYYDDATASDIHQTQHSTDEKITAPEMATRIADVLL